MSGIIREHRLWEIRQCKCMVILMDFPYNSVIFGLVCSLEGYNNKHLENNVFFVTPDPRPCPSGRTMPCDRCRPFWITFLGPNHEHASDHSDRIHVCYFYLHEWLSFCRYNIPVPWILWDLGNVYQYQQLCKGIVIHCIENCGRFMGRMRDVRINQWFEDDIMSWRIALDLWYQSFGGMSCFLF